MEEEIRALILKYGLRPVREGIEKEYRSMYDYLKTLYGMEQPQQQSQQEPTPESTSPIPIAEKKTIRKAKKVVELEQQQTLENTIEQIQDHVQEEEQSQEIIDEEIEEEQQYDPTDKEVTVMRKVKSSVATIAAPAQPYKEKTPEEVREAKQQHRDAVQKKRDEIVAKGIQPESLLTKENLEKWLKAGKSYQQIAREFTGVHETQVSAIAKAFGLQSSVSKLSGGFVRRTLAPS
jgi:hypothetical protein